MQFRDPTAIYEQISDYGIEQILLGNWLPEERIPSVRGLAAELGVNPNTVQRAYADLDAAGLLYNERGRGFFVAADGPREARTLRRKTFVEQKLPRLAADLHLLQIDHDELISLLQQLQNQPS